MRGLLRISVCLLLTAAPVPSIAADAPTAEQVEFFEKQVRPLLIQHCHECHGAKKQEAGLRLDTQAGFHKGSDSGPVFVAGDVNGSKLMQVLRYPEGGTQMPPKGKLHDEQIAVIRRWLEMGAPWPVESAAGSNDAAKHHWAFQPIQRPSLPLQGKQLIPSRPSLNQTSVDSFIAAALTEKELAISQPAKRETFIRRLFIDLVGTPPTFAEVCEFVQDAAPDACERLIDRLLASPLYGQRWGRHWLDVARYADSKGYVFTAEPRYPYSYTYRDYVVDAFNADLPFDRFVIEQLAADIVVDAEKGKPETGESHDPRLAALGFLTVGRRYVNNNNDIIDDRIDVVSRGLLGLTVGCARCHDHKFDPIPTADYYSLYGVFSSTTEPDELPIIGLPKSAEAYQMFLEELAKRETAVVAFEEESVPKLQDEIRDVVGDALQQIARQSPAWANVAAVWHGANDPRPPVVQRWKQLLERTATPSNRVWGPWSVLGKVSNVADFPAELTKLIESWSSVAGGDNVNAIVRQAIIEQKPANLLELARLYGKLLRETKAEWVELLKTAPDAKQLPDATKEELRLVLYGDASPTILTLAEARGAFNGDIQNKITNLKRKVDNLRVTSPGAPPRAMVVREGPVHEPVVFIRGNPGRPGKRVPRQFLDVASTSERTPFTKGSGRLELAETIVSPHNPLTARVIVNRIWQHHFGSGLVATPSDFGTRGLPPSHPQMLDWLAAELSGIESGPSPSFPHRWSLKRIHRLILASAVFRQSSSDNPMARGIDPENRLLWRMPSLRLDFESFRDSLLAVSGKLDDSLGGQPFEGVMKSTATRRTIYAFVNRNDLPGIFRAFDFADIDSSAAQRPETTVPQQSLFAMNSPFVHEQARRLAIECQAAGQDDQVRLNALYERVFSRQPTDEERALASSYLATAESTGSEKLNPWERLSQVLLMTNEFAFVD